MDTYYRIIILILLGLKMTDSSGQAATINSNHPVPLDETITYGKLDNGLRYYIKHLPESKDRIDLRFYVLAGFNHQDPDQVNMAHFVEHMGFKSAEHFPNGIHSDLLARKSLDMSQRDVNANTSNNHTEYEFLPPKGNQEALNTGLIWFKDIANGLHFKNDQINSERGVLIQEFMRSGEENLEINYSKNELDIQLVPCRQNKSGFIEHQKTFDSNRLKQFYKDWYHPDLMSIAVVGKIDDVPAIERQIRERFSEIKPNENPRKIPDCDNIFFNRPPRFVVVERPSESLKDNEKVQIELYFKDRKTLDAISSKKGIKRMNKIGFLIKILNNRLRETTNVYNSFFDIHVRHTHGATFTPSSFKVLISASNIKEKEAIQTFTRVLKQLGKHGVSESEFINARERRIDGIEQTTSYESRYWVGEIRDHLVFGEALPKDKRGYLKKWLMNYEASEFNEFIRELNLEMPEDIGIFAPTNHPALSYTEAEIRSLISGLDDDSISPYAVPVTPSTLMTSDQVKELKDSGFKDKKQAESGAHQLILENGVKVILKPLKDSSNTSRKRISLHAFNNKGALSYPTEDYFSVVNAPGFIKNSGVGKFNKFELERYTSNKGIRYPGIRLYVNNQEAGIALSTDIMDLEEMLQLVYLFFSQPRKDSLAFQDWKTQQQNYHIQLNDSEKVNLDNNIKKIIGDKSGVSQGQERFLGLEETDMEKGLEIYKDLFGNSQDFTFLVTGSFTVDSVTPLITRYLGNLPSNQLGTKETSYVSSFAAKPTGPVLVQLRSPDVNNTTKTNYTYIPSYYISTGKQVNWKEKLIARTLGGVLDVKIRELRFKKGYSLYSTSAGMMYNNIMNQTEFYATVRCTPDEYPLLRDEFKNIIRNLKVELVSEEMLEQALKNIRATEDPSGRGHSLHKIHEKLYNQYRFGESWVDQKEIMLYIESLTPKDILNAAKLYFKPENLYEFVMTAN